MLNGKTLMLLLGGVILSGCGPEPSDPQGNNPAELKQKRTIQKENSAQAGDDTVQKRQAEAAQQAAKKQPNMLKPKPRRCQSGISGNSRSTAICNADTCRGTKSVRCTRR